VRRGGEYRAKPSTVVPDKRVQRAPIRDPCRVMIQ
jgi:hypothetical protein